MLGLVWIGLVDHIGGIGLDYVGFVWIALVDHIGGIDMLGWICFDLLGSPRRSHFDRRCTHRGRGGGLGTIRRKAKPVRREIKRTMVLSL